MSKLFDRVFITEGRGSIQVFQENLYPVTKVGSHQPTIKTPYQCFFSGGPMMAQHRMLAE